MKELRAAKGGARAVPLADDLYDTYLAELRDEGLI